MRLIVSCIIFFCSIYSFIAQGNLQFNQIVTVSTTTMTVPSGKVWKVESYQQRNVWAAASSTQNCNETYNVRPYVIDGYNFYDSEGISTGYSNIYVDPGNRFPFWLTSGQTARTTCPGDFLSVIEFNIVP
jgi:hypothetical protein